jgi:hypothetical protein
VCQNHAADGCLIFILPADPIVALSLLRKAAVPPTLLTKIVRT